MRGHVDLPKLPGVYGIYNHAVDGIYVGSSISIWTRTKQHKTDLKCNRHPNEYLQRAYNKYGVDNFEMVLFELAPCAEKDVLMAMEQLWIDYCKTNYPVIYNGRPMAESTRGYHHTEEAKEKIRKNSKYFMSLPENREKYSKLTKERMQNPECLRLAVEHSIKDWNITIYDPDNNPHFVERNLKEFCIRNDLLYSNILRVVKGKQPYHRGWRIDPNIPVNIVKRERKKV